MTIKSVTSLALVAGCALALTLPAAQAQTGGDWDPARNVQQSREYMQLLQTNLGFREARIDRECGPITDPQLYQSCVASFDFYTPFVGDTRLAGNEWYPPNPQIATTQPHIVEHGLTGATMPPGGMTGAGWGTDPAIGMTGTTMPQAGVAAPAYGGGTTMTPLGSRLHDHHVITDPYTASRNLPAEQAGMIAAPGAMPDYPGPRPSGPLSQGGGGGGAGQ